MIGATSKRIILCEGFAPKNNLYIPANLFADTGLTQAQWTTLFDKYEKIYTPIVTARGGKLQLNRLWDDGTVNANADEADGVWTVNMYGGLARYPGMTPDGMALVVCHETGHHLGGAPKMGGDPTEWASNEGGADTFAVLKCARHMFADDDNATIVSQMSVEPLVQKTCQTQFQATQDQNICMRTATAGIPRRSRRCDRPRWCCPGRRARCWHNPAQHVGRHRRPASSAAAGSRDGRPATRHSPGPPRWSTGHRFSPNQWR